ncbi:stearoyl-CoA desaturase 5-like [Planococcus citri]|uniref:stearoyl-CoA desaturase 5-like n=1 Tax=Planococcus citri TaxID=170843 RepID=UPI0031F9B29C
MDPNETTVGSQNQMEEFIALNELQIPSPELAKVDGENNEKEKAIEEYEDMIKQPFLKRQDIDWKRICFFVTLHLVALHGFITFPYRKKTSTFIWGWFLVIVANFGISAGVHRLWCHKTYKAKLPLRIIYLIFHLVSGQYSMLNWVKDHRIHHKFSDTNADPVDPRRGFWFSHVGWLVTKPHPAVLEKAKVIDVSDVLSDPVVQFGEKYFHTLRAIIGFFLPIIVPIYFWNEDLYWAIISQFFMRYAYSLNCTWGVNSFAHMFGDRPYNRSIEARENIMMTLANGGEGWHNYHHTFPADYKASEYGNYIVRISLTTLLIDVFAKIGWAYDLKQPSEELVRAVILNRGDGSHWCSKSDQAKTKTN